MTQTQMQFVPLDIYELIFLENDPPLEPTWHVSNLGSFLRICEWWSDNASRFHYKTAVDRLLEAGVIYLFEETPDTMSVYARTPLGAALLEQMETLLAVLNRG